MSQEKGRRVLHGISDPIELDRDKLEEFFSQSVDGFFFMMLEKPVDWVKGADNDEMLDYIFQNQKITRVNQAMLDQYGAQPDDLLGKSAANFFEHDTKQGLKVWRKLLEDGYLHVDTSERRLDGSLIWIEGEYQCIYDSHGRFAGHLGLQRDVTKKRRNERLIKQSQEQYRILIDHIGEGIGMVNSFEFFTMANPAAHEIFGVEPGGLVGKCIFEFTPAEQSELVRNQTNKRRAGERSAYEMSIHRPDGSTRDLLITAVPQFEDSGTFSGTFAVFRDITETKRAQDAVKKQLVALTQPINDPHGIEFASLFNLNDIQRIQDVFAEATGVSSIITLPDGTPLTRPTNFCRLCKDVIRKTEKGLRNCIHSDSVIGRYNYNGPVIQQCFSGGLWDAGASITVGGKHVANWLVGQVRNEAQDDNLLLEYADEIGADKEEFKSALAEVPVMTLKQFTKVSMALYAIANELSLKAYQNIQQARFIIEKQKIEEELKASEQKYRTLVQYSSDPIFSYNPDKTYRFVNDAFAKAFGKSPEEIMGKTPYDLFSPEEASRRLDIVRKVFQTGTHESIDVRIDTATEGVRYFSTMADPIKDEDGNVLWVSCVSKDITNIRLAEEELINAKEKAVESDRLKSAFLANMSHEIRTPMNSIIGFAELLAEEEVNTEERKRYARFIESGSEQLLSLINDIIDISKIEAGQLTLNPVSIDVQELVEEVYEIFSSLRTRMSKHKIHLLLEISGIRESSLVITDRNRLRQVLLNLGHNAMKFTDSGSIVFGCNQLDNKKFRFFVRDSGIGIALTQQEYIFKRFRQVDEFGGRANRGTGLGLAICKNLVHLMGGEIGLESEPGKGSEFWFTIPLDS
jgi:PAS domain S-box-containing protein